MYGFGFVGVQFEQGSIGRARVAFGRVVKPVYPSAVTACERMTAGYQGEGLGMMAKLLLDVFEGLARF